MDVFHVMKILMTALQQYTMAPIRWYWEVMLMRELTKLGMVTQAVRENGMWITLMCSTATMDRDAIVSAVNLRRANLLSVEQLASVDWKTLVPHLRCGGMHQKKAQYISRAAKHLLDHHGGRLPSTFDALCGLVGLGAKTANIILNEVHGNPTGIAADRHVLQVAIALGLHVPPDWLKTLDPFLAEVSLRTWVSMDDFKTFNPVLGGMAQLFCYDYREINTKEKKENLNTLMAAVADHCALNCRQYPHSSLLCPHANRLICFPI